MLNVLDRDCGCIVDNSEGTREAGPSAPLKSAPLRMTALREGETKMTGEWWPTRKERHLETPKGNRRSLTAFGMTARWVEDGGDW
jgi:hypothetical protein